MEMRAKDGPAHERLSLPDGHANLHWKGFAALMLVVLTIHLGAGALLARPTRPPGAELKFVVIFSRHGVRPPTWRPERINRYSAEAWPKWGVPTGYLTSHGRTLIELLGAYDRAYLAKAGLLSATGCSDASRVYFWTDNEERTRETGRALATGMLPGCPVEVHWLPEGADDPLFNTVAAGLGHPDRALAAAAVSGRIGGNPKALQDLYRPQLETLEQVLLGCKPDAKCPPKEGRAPKPTLLEGPTFVVQGKGDHLADLDGPLRIASSLSEDFLLEYANGFAGEELGWGRVNESKVREMMALHAMYADLLRQTPYIARAQASNLLSHILKTLEQARQGKAVPGALGEPGDQVLVLVGHDTNISNMAGTLGLSWLVEGYQPDDTPPGCALVFELWREPASGEYTVRTYFLSQTLEQMRKALPLTLDSPPAKAPIFLPGCSTASEGLACGWEAFERTLEAAIDPGFVKP